ncbi:MAG: lipase family protein, partial [bacterium]|nr:lipase family protein [bacterium]
ELGRLCLQSYQMLIDFNKGVDFKLPAPFQLVKVFNTPERYVGEAATATEVPIAFVATQGDAIYVVFRGTVTITEWIDDATFAQVPYHFVSKGGLTEEGFTSIYGTVHQGILDTVVDLAKSGGFSTLYITGHSLGAALAVLAVPELAAKSGFTQPIMFNFAGPRVGNPAFSETTYNALMIQSVRVANTNDLVPKLPNPIVEVYQNGQFKTFFYDHVNEAHDITFGNPISGPTDFKDIEANHIMCNYYNALCKMTSDEKTCMEMADGADGCNAST